MPKTTASSQSGKGTRAIKRLCPCSQCGGVVKQPQNQIRYHLERDQRNASYAPVPSIGHTSTSGLVTSTSDPPRKIPVARLDLGAYNAALPPNHPHNDTTPEPAKIEQSFQLNSTAAAQTYSADVVDYTMAEAMSVTVRDGPEFPFTAWTPPDSLSRRPSPPNVSPTMTFTSLPTTSQAVQPRSQEREMAVDLTPLTTFTPAPPAPIQPAAASSRGPWLQTEDTVPVSMTPADVAAILDHVEHSNAVAAANAVPLTAHAAHSDPLSKNERRITRSMMRMLEEAQRAQQVQASSISVDAAADAQQDPEELPDVDASFDDSDEEEDEEDEAIPRSRPVASRVEHPWEDDTAEEEPVPLDNHPDPFYAGPYEELDTDSLAPSLHDVVLSVHAMVVWLSSQHNLARTACHVLLWFFGTLLLVLGFDSLARDCPRTLATVHRRVGTEPPIVLLPTCPGCQTVYPRTPNLTACPKCSINLYRNLKGSTRIPTRKYPTHAFEPQLRSLLARPGMPELLDSWRIIPRTPDTMHDIFDGEIAKSLKAPDGSAFFRNLPQDWHAGPDGELRIGVTLGLDWFSHIVSNIAPSHSSCPVSFNIANLPTHLRFRVTNLILVGILPGPREQTSDEIQGFLRWIVSELLRLWNDGIVVGGRVVWVILVAVICDKPAAHKVGGFGPVSHTFFCHCCWIKKDDLATPSTFRNGAFQPRTDKRHRQLGARYKTLKTPQQRDRFVKMYSTRYTELSRLPYFDTVRQVVIDPMHNLALGLVKTQFYTIWIKNKILRDEQLEVFHALMVQCDVPDHLGRLPTMIGMPAGGSLTADQWIILAMVMGPLIMPLVWDAFTDPNCDRVAAVTRFEQKKTAAKVQQAQDRKDREVERRREAKARKQDSADATPPQPTQKRKRATQPKVTPDDKYSMHSDDVPHFLKLSKALHLLLGHTIPLSSLPEADSLLRTYCIDIAQLYGTSEYKPNHHYATHTIMFVRDFGPLCGFWTFLFERLNRVLKSFNTNKHPNGDLEETFLREYARLAAHQTL